MAETLHQAPKPHEHMDNHQLQKKERFYLTCVTNHKEGATLFRYIGLLKIAHDSMFTDL